MAKLASHISFVLPATALLALASAGCIIKADSHVHRSGCDISRETLGQIEPGKKQDFVLALLGEPSTKTTLEGETEIWKWRYSEKRVRSGSLFLVFDSDTTSEREGSTFVQFEKGLVVKAWQD
jgi:outer membrane protein assembly factor BamE (lipoprotein component of BamABCDE complex)